MNHLTKLLIRSIASKQIDKFNFYLQNHNFSYQNVCLTTKNCFYEATFKSRGFKTNQNDLPFAEYMRKSIAKFPYCKLPKYNQKFSEDKQLQSQDFQALVAFSSLFVVNEQNKQKELKQMAQILLKQEFKNIVYDKLSGTQIFSLYYVKKLPEMVLQINEAKVSDQKGTYYLQVLTNIIPTLQIKGFVEKINSERIQKMSIHNQSLYIKLLLRHDLPYIHFLDKIYQAFPNKQQESKENPLSILQAAKTLLSIQNFQQVLSENIKSQSLRVIIKNITNMQAFDHIMVIKHIYMSSSSLCKEYIDRLTAEIMSLHSKKKSDELHVPLMLKVIKYRSKLHLDNKMFLDIINSYPQKFNTVFRQKNVNKEIFLSLTTKQATSTLNPEIRVQFGSYIRKVFEDYQKKDEIDEDDLVRDIKLILKYGSEISREQLNTVFEVLIEEVYQRIKHAVSEEVKYYIFLACYTFNFQQNLKNTGLVQEVVTTYHNKCSTSPNSQFLSKMINIEYQLSRKDSFPESRKNIFVYNYSQVQLHSSVYSYLIFLMKKQKSKGTNQEKVNVITQLKKNIYKNLSNGNFSMKIIYTLIDVLDQLKYSDKFMHVDIERAIAKNIEKALSNQKKNGDLPLPKDISFLKNKLSRNNKCSTKFDEFLQLCDKNYNLITEHAKEYLQKSKNWEKIRQNFKRNLEKETSKVQKNQT